MDYKTCAVLFLSLVAVASAQNILSDPGRNGVTPEIVHLYFGEWPTGIAVSKSGRMFSNYPPFLDANDQNYTVAELTSNTTEKPYPNAEINMPPGGRVNRTTDPPTASNSRDHIVGSQSVVIDPADRLWILDTGRVMLQDGTMLPAAHGGPKLLGVDLRTDKVFKTIIFDPLVAPPDSYLNDIRFDLDPQKTSSGQGVAYITDSSPEGRNALVTVDLGSGDAWRHLDNVPSVTASQGFVPTIWGEPVYTNSSTGVIGNVNFGADGIALSPDGETLWYSTTGGRELYSVPTERLRAQGGNSEVLAEANILYHGQHGFSDGMETDSNGIVYAGNLEDNSVSTFDPRTGILGTFSRDPRYSWSDTFSVAEDGFIYYTENQLWLRPVHHGGVDRRVKPWVLFRAKLPNGGTKVVQPAPSGGNSSSSGGA